MQESLQRNARDEPPAKRSKVPLKSNAPPQLLVPFFEEIISQEQIKAKENFVCLSQIEITNENPKKDTYSFKEVYIKGIVEEYQVRKLCLIYLKF